MDVVLLKELDEITSYTNQHVNIVQGKHPVILFMPGFGYTLIVALYRTQSRSLILI